MKNTLRLLLFEDCNRNCEGCCNKDFNLIDLPVEKDFSQYKTIILTGGEPMLKPGIVAKAINQIRTQNPTAKILMYTAKVNKFNEVLVLVSNYLNGITVTLHEQKDVKYFIQFLLNLDLWIHLRQEAFSFRLNVFKGVNIDYLNSREMLNHWKVKTGIEWIKNCPLPTNEVFKRYERKK